jgi:signal transduction histidine kinase
VITVATTVVTQAQPSTRNSNPITFVRHWFEPRSTERDLAFRERTIRVTVGFLIAVGVLNLVTSPLVFKSAFTLLSFPSLLTLVLVFCVASAVAVSQKRMLSSALLLVVALAIGGFGTIVLIGYWDPLVPTTMMLVILLAALVLPRSTIIWAAVAMLAIYGATALWYFYVSGVSSPLAPSSAPWPQIVTYLFMYLIEAFILRQLRVEFDGRMAATTEALAETQAARQEAEKANKAKSQFLANMSHELRTPLNAVIGYAEIMIGGLAGAFSPEQGKLIDSVQKNARRLLNLINDILDLSRVESGRIELRLEAVSPKTVLSDTAATLQSLADKKGLKLELTFSPDTPSTIIIDSAKLQQVAVNLLGNSLKFTKQGKVELLTDSKTPTTWEFKVRDTGIGIPKEALPSIFDVFQQVDSTDSRQYEGTGLGLAIVKTLVEHMKGTVTVESTVGAGTTFTITLPKTVQI